MRRPSIKTAEWMRTRLWPDFVERDGCVFVEFNIGDLTPAPPSGRRLTDWELFHNHTQLFHEFPSGAYEWVFVERASADLDVYEPLLREEHSDFLRAKQLGETMASMWATKLKQDFPADRFRVFYLHHDATTLRFHKVRPEEGWLTDEEFMSRSEKYLWDGILYDTDYLERPVRRMDSEPGAPVGKGSSRQGVLKGKTRTAGDFDAPSPLGATAVFKGDRTE